MIHELPLERATLHGHFSRDLPPILEIEPGDRLRGRTLDAYWHEFEQEPDFDRPVPFPGRDEERDPGHALCGPVLVRGARAGMVLEVRVERVETGRWGWTSAGDGGARQARMGLHAGPAELYWTMEPGGGWATERSGRRVALRPFMGVLGMPPAEPGRHSTIPPRATGGNLDCRELVPGTSLFLPIAVDGALFSFGDGHAAQGDGEIAGPALECPMTCELSLHLHPDLRLAMPRARTPSGWVTVGLHEDLEEAAYLAANGMLDLLVERLRMDRHEAAAFASVVMDLRISQLVNFSRGVHAMVSDAALAGLESC